MPWNCQEEKTVDTALTTRCHVGPRGHFPRKGKGYSPVYSLEEENEGQRRRGRENRGQGMVVGRREEAERNEPYEVRFSIHCLGMQNGRCRSQRTTEQ